jgi:hypothetical protein
MIHLNSQSEVLPTRRNFVTAFQNFPLDSSNLPDIN